MTSGGCLEAWLIAPCMHNTAVHWKCHTSRRPPDVILCRSFTRPSTVLGDRRPGNEASKCTHAIAKLMFVITFYIHPQSRWQGFLIRISVVVLSTMLLLWARIQLMNTGPPQFQAVDNPASFAESLLTRVSVYTILNIDMWFLDLCIMA